MQRRNNRIRNGSRMMRTAEQSQQELGSNCLAEKGIEKRVGTLPEEEGEVSNRCYKSREGRQKKEVWRLVRGTLLKSHLGEEFS